MAITAAPEITTMAIEMSEVGLKAESVAGIAASCGEKIIGEGMEPPLLKIRLAMRNARRSEMLATDE
jgi:hypothetical protein